MDNEVSSAEMREVLSKSKCQNKVSVSIKEVPSWLYVKKVYFLLHAFKFQRLRYPILQSNGQ